MLLQNSVDISHYDKMAVALYDAIVNKDSITDYFYEQKSPRKAPIVAPVPVAAVPVAVENPPAAML